MEPSQEANASLSSGEIGYLWQTYQYEPLSICAIRHFIEHDQEMKALLGQTLQLSEKRVAKVPSLLTEEDHLIPEGFTEGDVHLKTPRLFTDEWYLDDVLHTLQIATYANEGADIMTNNAWMDKPPMVADRKALAKKSNE